MGGKHRCMQAPLACEEAGVGPPGQVGGLGVGVGLKLNPETPQLG